MLTVLFYYTLTIMLIVVVAGSVALSAYFVSRRKTFLWLFATFIFYFFDVSLVFFDDFVMPSQVMGAQTFWDVGNPVAMLITGTGMLAFLWMALCAYMGRGNRALIFAPTVAFVVLSAASYILIGNIRWREFAYYSQREVFLFFMFAMVAFWFATGDEALRAQVRRHRVAYAASVLLACCIVLENVFVQLIFDPAAIPDNTWFFAERSPSENMLFICFAIVTVRAAAETLRLRYDAPPRRSDEPMAEQIARVLPLYARDKGLSEREAEVLALIVMGKDNQNIASELVLAPSTVKVHVHNILKKTNLPDRRALMQDFWKK